MRPALLFRCETKAFSSSGCPISSLESYALKASCSRQHCTSVWGRIKKSVRKTGRVFGENEYHLGYDKICGYTAFTAAQLPFCVFGVGSFLFSSLPSRFVPACFLPELNFLDAR